MKPFMEVFQEAFQRSFKTWPLYGYQIIIEFLRVVTFYIASIIAFWPLGAMQADFANMDFSRLSNSFASLMWENGWWKIAVIVFFLYMVWWLIIEALVNGAIFSRLWAYLNKGEKFMLERYFREGFQYFLPLIGLNLLTFIVGVVVSFIIFLFLGGLLFLLSGVGLLKPLANLLSILVPLGTLLLLSVVLTFFGIWWIIARGFITSDHGMMESLRLSFRKCIANKGRILWGVLLLFTVFLAVLLIISIPFAVLQIIPFVGWLFYIINVVIVAVLTAFLAVYVPSVVVAFLGEKEVRS